MDSHSTPRCARSAAWNRADPVRAGSIAVVRNTTFNSTTGRHCEPSKLDMRPIHTNRQVRRGHKNGSPVLFRLRREGRAAGRADQDGAGCVCCITTCGTGNSGFRAGESRYSSIDEWRNGDVLEQQSGLGHGYVMGKHTSTCPPAPAAVIPPLPGVPIPPLPVPSSAFKGAQDTPLSKFGGFGGVSQPTSVFPSLKTSLSSRPLAPPIIPLSTVPKGNLATQPIIPSSRQTLECIDKRIFLLGSIDQSFRCLA
ncbi:hypothetical protein B0H12DRAFT_1421 [Mycena haematopus]|nr:hypothetical protein B0H12DRAFT_1421 [Mycena haematopus]